jgi:hypothetical protein
MHTLEEITASQSPEFVPTHIVVENDSYDVLVSLIERKRKMLWKSLT